MAAVLRTSTGRMKLIVAIFVAGLAMATLSSGNSTALADEVVLIPATITGTVQMAGMPVGNVNIYANWSDQSASISVNGGNTATSVTYTLTVNVPQGATPEYTVRANANFDGNKTYIQFANRAQTVSANGTFTVNFGQANPARITGTIQMGTEGIYYVNLRASGGGASTRTTFYAGNPTSATYTLYVDVPGTSAVTFSMPYYYNDIYLGDWNRSVSFGNLSVQVAPGATVTLNLGTATPAYIEGNVTVTNGTLNYAYVYAYSSSGNPQSRARSDSSGFYRMPVMPGINYRVYGTAYLSGGPNIGLPSQYTVPSTQTYVQPAAGQTATADWSVTVASSGSIEGTVTVTGSESLWRHYVQVSGPESASAYLNENGPYEFADLSAGSYSLYAYAIYDSAWDRYTQLPYSTITGGSATTRPRPVVNPGQATVVDVTAEQAVISGNWTISGTHSLSEVSYDIDLRAYGAYNTGSYGGNGYDEVNRQTGTYKLVLTDGAWNWSYVYRIRFLNYDPEEYLNSEIRYLYDYTAINNPITLTAGETVTRNFNYKTGDVTVTFRVEGGGALSNPRLEGSCEKRDDANNLVWRYNIYAYSSVQTDVTEGAVTMVGLEGACTITARAYVAGSLTTFGQLSLDVVPGADVVVDIGGPDLTIDWPAPDEIVATSAITVTGTATDDTAVASVTVNGVAATLIDTSVGGDMSEVSFSVEIIGLSLGPNQLVTVATDTSDKTATDTRTVYYDEEPPHLEFTPADGTVTSATEITVEGLASNDAGVASVIVEGQTVTITSTDNPNDPTEVSFSVPMTLQPGENFIDVVATDISGRTTGQTHKVTVSDNQPPECNDLAIILDEDTVIERLLPCTDADAGDTIEIEIVSLSLVSVAPVNVTGPLPFTVPAGSIELAPDPDFNGDGGSFTFRATDASGAQSPEATATITVTPVNDPPTISADNANVTVDEGDTANNTGAFDDVDAGDVVTITASAGSVSQVGSQTGTWSWSFNTTDGPADTQTVTITATDNAGAQDTVLFALVVNNVAPTFTNIFQVAPIPEGSVSTSGNIVAQATDPAGSNDPLTFDFDCDNNGSYETPAIPLTSAADCFFDDNGTYTVGVRVDDGDGGVTTGSTNNVVVTNVPPTAFLPNAASVDEGSPATFTFENQNDPSNADVNAGFRYSFACDGLDGSLATSYSAAGTSDSTDCTFGDDGGYTVKGRIFDKDDGSNTYSATVNALNVAPTLTLDTTGSITFAGGDAFIGRKDTEQTHDASATDPGSDDLTFDWSFPPDASSASNSHLNDGSFDPDPDPSPTINPRDETDSQTVTFGTPGIYTVAVTVTDDDAGSDAASLSKLVTDDCDCTKSQGYWKKQFKERKKDKPNLIDEATLLAYLDIVRFGSGIFDEDIALPTIADAYNVFDPPKSNNGGGTGAGQGQGSRSGQASGSGLGTGQSNGGTRSAPGSNTGTNLGKKREKALKQTLAAWLNFAYGAIDWDEMVDTDEDGVPDMAFGDLIGTVEAILSDPNATADDLEQAKDLAEAVNQHDKDNPDCDTGTGSQSPTSEDSNTGDDDGDQTQGSDPGSQDDTQG